jgi:hypothetical protein
MEVLQFSQGFCDALDFFSSFHDEAV